MDNSHKSDKTNLDLDLDEVEHLRLIPNEWINLLKLTDRGTVIILNMTVDSCPYFGTTNQRMILCMFILKTIEQLRAAIRGIMFGHYSAVLVLLRSTLDSVSVIHLISRNERHFKIWLLLNCIYHEKLEVDKNAANKLKSEFNAKVRQSYDALFSSVSSLTPVTDLMNKFNPHIHSDVFSLFDRVGGQKTSREVIDDVKQALSISGEDPLQALKLLNFAQEPQKEAIQPYEESETSFGAGFPDKKLLARYSPMVHYATHCLYEIVEYLFGDELTDSFHKDCLAWYELSKKELENKYFTTG
jgi:hypothetical protein